MKPEQVEMIIIFDWIRKQKLHKIAFHIANERKTTPQGGALLRRMGVLAGVSDIFLARARNGFHGLFLEIKVEGGKLSQNQIDFLKEMDAEGYDTDVCWNHKEAIKRISEYLHLPSGTQ